MISAPRRSHWLACVLSLIPLWAAAYAQPSSRGDAVLAAAGDGAPAPLGSWWGELGDAGLNRVVEVARRRVADGDAVAAGAVEAQAAQAYVGVRTAALRWEAGQAREANVLRQREWLFAHAADLGPANATALLAQLDAKRTALALSNRNLQAQTVHYMERLAGLCDLQPQLLSDLIRSALQDTAADETAPTVRVATNSVSRPVSPDLAQRANAAVLWSQTVAGRQRDVDLARLRVAAGETSEIELLETEDRYLGDADRLIVAEGVLAMEWIRVRATAAPLHLNP
jgi:hypothetical protein